MYIYFKNYQVNNMDLTIYDLKNIKKNCENLTTVIDNIIKTKYTNNSDTPFNSLSDYENSVKDKLIRPELYYKVQIYDRMTYITYRKNTKQYHIVIRGFYSEYLNNYKRYSNSEDTYIISNDFDKTKEVWYNIILECIKTLKPIQELEF